MKKINITKIGILVLMLLVLGSCKKFIDTDINIDPNKPSVVTMETLLPTIEARMAFTIIGGNDIARVEALWIQQLDGVERQSLAETNYQLKPGDVNNMWNAVYSGIFADLQEFMGYAETAGSTHNLGVGKILQAHTLGASTDVWNSMPWTEALQGTGNLTPAFDSQESLYNAIMSLLAEGISDLESSDESGYSVSGDYFYDGDVDMWIKAAHALMARYALHLTKMDASMYATALEQIGMAMETNDGDMQFGYGSNISESNPFYQFMQDRGDVRMNAYLIDMLKTRQDPRLPVFALPDEDGEYTGSVTGTANTAASMPGPALAGATTPTYFVTHMEMLLDKAICLYKTGGSDADVRQALIDGVTASLEKYEVYSEAYITGYTQFMQTVSGEALYAEVVTQKYIALTYQSESYNDWRRSNNIMGIPVNPNGAETQIPRRFPYASDELSYNPNTPQGVLITDRVWWDAE